MMEWLAPSNPCRQFDGNERLFQALKTLNNTAILCVQTRAMPSARKFAQQYGLPPGSADEVLNQSTLIFLRKTEVGRASSRSQSGRSGRRTGRCVPTHFLAAHLYFNSRVGIDCRRGIPVFWKKRNARRAASGAATTGATSNPASRKSDSAC